MIPAALVTRAAEDAPRISAALEAAGWRVRHLPLLRRVPHPSLADDLAAAPAADVVLLTSPATAHLVCALGAPTAPVVAAVGPRTEEVARQYGWTVHVRPHISDGEHLIAALGPLEDRVVLYPGAKRRTPSTGVALREAGAVVHDLVAYTNMACRHDRESVCQALPVTVAPLLSSSAAERLSRMLRRHDIPLDHAPVVAIGESTLATAKKHGLVVLARSEKATIASLVAACEPFRSRSA